MGRDCINVLTVGGCLNFNPRTRMGRDTLLIYQNRTQTGFQSTHPHGARPCNLSISLNMSFISIHAPAWGATEYQERLKGLIKHFNPRTRMGRDTPSIKNGYWYIDFNPRTRMGRDYICLSPFSSIYGISIHAPAWGATSPYIYIRVCIHISIHAPAWGATWLRRVVSNPQHFISIHAPAWGATFTGDPVIKWFNYFNPRTRMGRDDQHHFRPVPGRYFNPRTRMGRDRIHPGRLAYPKYFNPRTRMGRDESRVRRFPGSWIFQSTHPHGARRRFEESNANMVTFQSTHPHGARRQMTGYDIGGITISIHAPAWGATHWHYF